jgi:hypothetical protein
MSQMAEQLYLKDLDGEDHYVMASAALDHNGMPFPEETRFLLMDTNAPDIWRIAIRGFNGGVWTEITVDGDEILLVNNEREGLPVLDNDTPMVALRKDDVEEYEAEMGCSDAGRRYAPRPFERQHTGLWTLTRPDDHGVDRPFAEVLYHKPDQIGVCWNPGSSEYDGPIAAHVTHKEDSPLYIIEACERDTGHRPIILNSMYDRTRPYPMHAQFERPLTTNDKHALDILHRI